jgi:hypothetical protein
MAKPVRVRTASKKKRKTPKANGLNGFLPKSLSKTRQKSVNARGITPSPLEQPSVSAAACRDPFGKQKRPPTKIGGLLYQTIQLPKLPTRSSSEIPS